MNVEKLRIRSLFRKLFGWIGYQNNSTNIHNGDKLYKSTKIEINNSGDQVNTFKDKNELFAIELKKVLKTVKENGSLKTEDLNGLQERFNSAETHFELLKISHYHINEIKEFPDAAINYYEVIIGTYKKDGYDVKVYEDKRQYYEKLKTNNTLEYWNNVKHN